MNIVAFIFARGGSRGLPGKNIRLFGGKPLIAWSIEHAMAVKRIQRVIVSTDSHEIADVARQFGADVPFLRPAELARDDSPEWLAWRHALAFFRNETGGLPDAMVSIPTTSPLRLPFDIECCLNEFQNGGVDIVLTVTEARRSPYFNMVKVNRDETVDLVIRPHSAITRRQDAPVVYDMATACYVAKPEFVMVHGAIFEGKVKAVSIPNERAIDIDNLLDFQIAECLLKLREARF